jgi:hypothetical protein
MHSLPNQSVVRRFRLAAVLLLLKWIFFTAALSLCGYSMIMDRRDLMVIGIASMVLGVIVSLLHWAIAGRARCPLCFVPSFSHQQCAKNRKALHFLGSYRLFVSLSVVFRGWFRCPYCGEPTSITVSQRFRNRRL